jgi:hypothetical protein
MYISKPIVAAAVCLSLIYSSVPQNVYAQTSQLESIFSRIAAIQEILTRTFGTVADTQTAQVIDAQNQVPASEPAGLRFSAPEGFIHDATLEITAQGSLAFGSQGPDVRLYHDGISKQPGDAISVGTPSVGAWGALSGSGYVATDHPNSGASIPTIGPRQTLQYYADDNAGVQGKEEFTELFIAWSTRDPRNIHPSRTNGIRNVKEVWMMLGGRGDNTGYCGAECGHDVFIPGLSGSKISGKISGNQTRTNWWLNLKNTWNIEGWNRQHFGAKLNLSDPYGSPEIAFYEQVSSRGYLLDEHTGSIMTDQSAANVTSAVWDRIKFGGYYYLQSGDERVLDDIYIAIGPAANARVMLADSGVQADITKTSFCIPTDWSSSDISCTIKRGVLQSSDDVWAYVYDQTNTEVSRIQIHEADSSTPAAPTAVVTEEEVEEVIDEPATTPNHSENQVAAEEVTSEPATTPNPNEVAKNEPAEEAVNESDSGSSSSPNEVAKNDPVEAKEELENRDRDRDEAEERENQDKAKNKKKEREILKQPVTEKENNPSQSTFKHQFIESDKAVRGSEGEHVRWLQKALNHLGHRIANSGDGSVGNETTYFGPATERALQRFQAANGIVSSGAPDSTGYGAFGPSTRSALNAKLAATPATLNTVSPEIQARINEILQLIVRLQALLADREAAGE